MEIGNYVSQQLLAFLRAIALGACLGLEYDVLGALRRLGGKVWGGVLDAAFCLTAASASALFVLAGDGELRIFTALGIAGGALLFRWLAGPLLRPVWSFWVGLALLPVSGANKILKKCGRTTKKSFSFCRKWFTMKFTILRGRKPPQRQKGEEDMAGPAPQRKPPAPRKKGKTAKTVRSRSKLTLLLLAALMVGVSVQIYRMFGQLRDARAQEAAYSQRLEELREENRQLQEDLDNQGSQALIEDIARDQLGMVLPGEKVFHLSR